MSDSAELADTGPQVTKEDIERMLADSRRLPELERELREERQARAKDRDAAAGVVKSEVELRYKAEFDAAEGAIAAARARADQAEDAIAAAHEQGDARALAKANRMMSEATAQLDRFTGRKEWLESNKDAILRQAAPPRPAVREEPEGDDLDKIVKDLRPSEKAWLRDPSRYDRFRSDENYRQKVYGASYMALGEGLARGSSAYMQRMTELLGEAARQEREEGGERPAPRQMSADVAPGRRQAPGAQPPGGRDFTLTPDEREVADGLYGNANSDSYIADQAERYKHYYDNKQKARQAGRL